MSEGIEDLDFDVDEQEAVESSRAGLPNFTSLVRSAMTKDGIDLSVIDRVSEGLGPTNGGRRCDVSKGPCSCGAWH